MTTDECSVKPCSDDHLCTKHFLVGTLSRLSIPTLVRIADESSPAADGGDFLAADLRDACHNIIQATQEEATT